jgi:hypothetical protein
MMPSEGIPVLRSVYLDDIPAEDHRGYSVTCLVVRNAATLVAIHAAQTTHVTGSLS